jgi:nitrate/nitrite transport system permease protein
MTAQNVLQRMAAMVQPKVGGEQLVRAGLRNFGPALLGIVIFLVLWHVAAKGIVTSLGNLPGPVQVWEQAGNLMEEHDAERAREAEFKELQAKRKAEFLARSPEERQGEEFTTLTYTGKPTYIDQILTSLFTVFAGFIIGTIIAIPIGIFCGLSKTVQAALNPFIRSSARCRRSPGCRS